ncbi:MAG: ABC transporter permease [Nitrosomonas sp.]|nr:ABC transporter permease [Nitrosomonas sp.]MBK7363787.1 ABC transporter permease [Nitrosomonas sp.]
MLKLAARNLYRQVTHSLMTLIAIMSGVISIIIVSGWINDIFVQLGEALIQSQTGHIQVYKRGYYELGTRFPEKYLIPSPDHIKQVMSGTPITGKIMGRLYFSGLLNNGHNDFPITGEGIEPELESASFGNYVQIVSGRMLTDNDQFGIMLGQGIASMLGLTPDDHVTILTNTLDGTLNSLDFKVIGIFQSYSNDYDARAVKIPLTAAQMLINSEGINVIVVSLTNTKQTATMATLLKSQLSGLDLDLRTWQELSDYYEKTVLLYESQFKILQWIILIMVTLSVFNSVSMSIFERVGEFGTMMALGNRSSQVYQLIISENLILGLVGSIVGVGLALLLAFIISAIGVPMPPPPNASVGYIAQIQIIPFDILIAVVIGLGATLLATIYPARKVTQIKIVDALRQNY